MVSEAVSRLRGHYAAVVATNGVVPDALWNKPCIGYNVQYSLTAIHAEAMAGIQQDILRVEPTALVACPSRTLHISVALILGAKIDYDRPKNELWSELGRRCFSGLRVVAEAVQPFTVDFTELVVTDAAVIAVGEEDGSMSKLRARIAAALPIPEATRNSADIVHVTLLRYTQRFEPWRRLMEAAATRRFHVSTTVDRLAIVEETIYPSLETTVLFSAPLGAR